MTITEYKRQRSPHQPVGRWIRADKRLAIYLRDGFCCLACGRDLHGANPREVTLDHVIPQSAGGSNEADNLYTCCGTCNAGRGAKALHKAFGRFSVQRIRKHLRRSLTRYRELARDIIGGDVNQDDAVETIREAA